MLKSKRILLAVLSLGLLIAGCKEDEEVKPGGKITAEAGANQQVKTGDLVQLDGSGSRDSDNKPFTFRWTFSKTPAGSKATLTKPSEAKASFVPDVAGEYEAELTVSNENGESKDKVVIVAAGAQPIVLETSIRAKTTLTDRIADPNLPDYIADGNISVHAELVVEPGVTIAFARDTRLEINDNGGVLLSKGTAEKPIRLIGKEGTKGFWSGVIFRSGSSANALEYVEITNAGGRALISNIKAGMALIGGSKSQISIKNSVFKANDGYGLYIESGAIIGAFEKNRFTENTAAGVLVNADNVRHLDYNSTYTDKNGRNVIEIYSSNLAKNVTAEVVWAGFKDKTPYRILENLSSEANWKLAPGVTIEVGRNGRISIDDGYISARGTQADTIVIRGIENTAAFWRGLISFSQHDNNIFEFALISGGGNSAIVSGKKANIAVYGGGARMKILHSKIAGSGGYGVFANYQATVNEDIETVNTFVANAEGKFFKER